MATVQNTFKYEGDASASALNNVNLHFKIPTFEFITVLKDGRPFPERNDLDEQLIILNKKLSDTNYEIAIPNEFLVGYSDNSLKNFYAYLSHIGFTNNDPRLLDSLSAEIGVGISDEKENLFGQIQMPSLYSLSTASDKYKDITDRQAALYSGAAFNEEAAQKLELELADYIRKNIFIINKTLFAEAAIQFRLAEPGFNEYALFFIIAHVTDVSSGEPKIKIVADKFQAFLKTQFGIGSTESIKTLLEIIKDDLFDFPVTVPEITTAEIKGTFKIITPGNSEVAINDFKFFDLSVEYTIQTGNINPHTVVTSFDWAGIQQSPNNTVDFSFAPVITNLINSLIQVRVKAYYGSVVWDNQYAVTNPDLQNLIIEVPLLKPAVVTAGDEPKPSGGNKKLTGKVVEMSGACKLKDLTVVIQAKKTSDTIWKIVGAATTDSSGNFSLPYPYGNYIAAQALVSLMPDSPADINVYKDAAHIAINETIADDFLYLLLKDVNCEAKEEKETENCDCKDIKKSNRLPNQEELIKSDSYTQDIGGSCVNLSIPNRTLNEFPQVAIVRTSDPDVANYILSKDSKGNFILEGGLTKIVRKPVDLGNPIYWQDAPDDHANLSLYQAVTVATGHILHYSIITKADGYSMGELLYSLPLAPGQKKEIVIFEQTHTLMGSESQRLSQRESLAASLVNDVSITDTIAGNLAESTKGSSSASTAGVSGGSGIAGIIYGIAGTSGVAGGVANSNSTASQNSSRSLSEYFHEQMKNAINQNAQSYREMNASVITTVQEGQNYGVTTEVVANHNHCHSLTMMYFEVLRHYAIYQELSYVEECLFIPLLMTDFTRENIFKWRDVLASHLLPMPSETYLQPFTFIRSGRQHPLLKAFDANERIKTEYKNVDYPDGRYCDENITSISGSITIRANFPRPKTRFDRLLSLPIIRKTVTTQGGVDIQGTLQDNIKSSVLGAATGGLSLMFGGGPSVTYTTESNEVLTRGQIFDLFMTLDQNYESVPPAQCIRVHNFNPVTIVVNGVPKTIDFFSGYADDKKLWESYAAVYKIDLYELLNKFSGNVISDWDKIFNDEIAPQLVINLVSQDRVVFSPFGRIDLTSLQTYSGREQLLRYNLRAPSSVIRASVSELSIQYNKNSSIDDDKFNFLKGEKGIKLNVESLDINYVTDHYNGKLYSGYVGDNLFDSTIIPTPLNSNEKRNPRKEDEYLQGKLIEHLNSNLEYYNIILWRDLDGNRRCMLLDGFNIETYNDFGQPVGYRSLASVVKNELIGISGNALIMPVAPGYKIDRTFVVEQPIEGPAVELNLLEHYKPLTPIPPYRVSIPSKGVFAEAVQGACDACEKVKENTSQDWEKFKPDEPTAINPVTVPVPTVTDWRAAFKDFATPIVNIQNAPAAPAPGAGLAGVTDLLGKSDVFKDITGLDQNQKNALQTYLSNQQNAKDFAQMAKDIFTMDNNTKHSDAIADSIRNSPELSKEEKAQLLKDHFGQMVDGGQTKKAEQENALSTKPSLTDAAVEAADQGKAVKATSVDGDGKAESVDIGAGGVGKKGTGVPGWALAVGPFPDKPDLVFLDNPELNQAFKDVKANNPTNLCIGLFDLTDDPFNWRYAGVNDHEMLYPGSMMKIVALYAAFALRNRVQHFFEEAKSNALTDAKSIFALIDSAWRPQLKKLFPKRPESAFGLMKNKTQKQDIVMPQLDAIFEVSSGKVEFKSDPNVTDAKLDFVGAPPNKDGDPAEFGVVGLFKEWLRGMTRWSSNSAAGKCIDALGYFYINGLLRNADFFVPDSSNPLTGEGLWLSGDYQSHDWVSNADDYKNNAAGPKLTAHWAHDQASPKDHTDRIRSNMAGTAFQATRLMTLMAVDRLVNSDTVHPNPCAEMRDLLSASIAKIGPKSGIGSWIEDSLIIKDALDIPPKMKTDALQAKKGYGDERSSHECGIVERTVITGGKKLKYVAVVLGSLDAQQQKDFHNVVQRLDKVVVTINP
ncbi:MAG: hypothetical protein ABI760_19440 [Ferruginibacter sp.]